MANVSSGLLHRLLNAGASALTGDEPPFEKVKQAVVRDLEAMLNTRSAQQDERLRRLPQCKRSIVTYGLPDVAGLSLSSSEDRARLCREIETAIARHEPRLRDVRVSLEGQAAGVNRLQFNISGKLVLPPMAEAVNFDLILQPSSLHYQIGRARTRSRLGSPT